MSNLFIKGIEKVGDYYAVAKAEGKEDCYPAWIVDLGDCWGLMQRGGGFINSMIGKPKYVQKLFTAFDAFGDKELPKYPEQYQPLQVFKTRGSLSPEEVALLPKIDWGIVGYKIKSARTATSLSQQDLSRKTGISQSRLSRIESDQVDLSCTELCLIADELKKPEAFFFEEYRVEDGDTVWIKNEELNHYEPYNVIGMSGVSEIHRMVFIVPVSYHKDMIIEEGAKEIVADYRKHDYQKIQVVSMSDLTKAANAGGYILTPGNTKKDYAK